MSGRKSLSKLQVGRESTAGTAVAATTILRGSGRLLDNRLIERVPEDVAIIGGTDRTNNPMKGGGLAWSQVATFEQILHFLEAGIATEASPTQDGAGSGYIYDYPFPSTAAPTIKTYTLEGGDDNEAERMAYCFVNDFTLSGTGRRPYQLSANWVGRSVEVNAFTSLSTLVAVNTMNFGMTKIYIDAIGGTIGTTIKSNTVRMVNFKYTTGIQAKDTADGRLDFSFAQTGQDYICKTQVEFEHDATAAAQKVNWRAETPVLVRIKIEGSTAFASAGTTYSVPTVLIDLPAKWENFEKLGDVNGNNILRGTFFTAYNTTAARTGSITVVAAVATVP
ncbi:MAG TPA: hypothetical protein VFU31_05495 [Candidatus Binatia bacterium]|nr:hypothetical protein [Candidatus Binatia bacterium]